MSWMITYTGRQFWPLAPNAADVDVRDIAHALSNLCRFNGHTHAFYSVAQHSVLVSMLVPAPLRMAALLHDAAEAYMADIVRPIKRALDGVDRLEAEILRAIGVRMGEPMLDLLVQAPEIKAADLVLLATERRDLIRPHAESWPCLEGVEPSPEMIVPWSPAVARECFLHELRLAERDCE